MILEAYINLKNRNKRVKQLRSEGYNVKVHTSRGSRFHPQYVNDYKGTYETGSGNTDYLTIWGSLYHLEARMGA